MDVCCGNYLTTAKGKLPRHSPGARIRLHLRLLAKELELDATSSVTIRLATQQSEGDPSAMDSVASQRATTALAAGETAAESRSLGLRCCSENAASPRNKVADSAAAKAAQFEREVVPLRESLYRHALRMCQNHDDAEDLVQETMVKAYRNFHSFGSDSNLRAWLYRIQTNTYINAYRRRRRRPVEYSADGVTDHELATQARRISTGHVSAEDQALAALPDTEIMAAMRSLPEQFRAVVYYADVEGFRYREIADIMGTPRGTVSSRLQRGRQHLRRLLADAAHPGLRGRPPASARVGAMHVG
jgi:RNA polymerase sigma-70 factor, ECF subfamily